MFQFPKRRRYARCRRQWFLSSYGAHSLPRRVGRKGAGLRRRRWRPLSCATSHLWAPCDTAWTEAARSQAWQWLANNGWPKRPTVFRNELSSHAEAHCPLRWWQVLYSLAAFLIFFFACLYYIIIAEIRFILQCSVVCIFTCFFLCAKKCRHSFVSCCDWKPGFDIQVRKKLLELLSKCHGAWNYARLPAPITCYLKRYWGNVCLLISSLLSLVVFECN